jgi:tRNA-dihydrouridine synthase B
VSDARGWNLPPLRIGAVELDLPVVLAPMAGYTDSGMRAISREFGCALTFTEVVSAEGIVHGSARTLDLLRTADGEWPVVAHLYGSKPETLARAAAFVETCGRFAAVDLNCGCPVPKIVARGAGSALMRQPERVEAIVAAMCRATALPVTVKTRIGLDVGIGDGLAVARAAEQGGAAMVSVHARLAAARHSGPADWEALARIREQLRIPVVGNGGVQRPEDVRRMAASTGVAGVMVGRAAVGNPWFFRDVRALARGEDPKPPTDRERREVILNHLDRMITLMEHPYPRKRVRRPSHSPARLASTEFRGHLARYLAGTPGWPLVRRRLNGIKSPADIAEAVALAFGDGAGEPGGSPAPAAVATHGIALERAVGLKREERCGLGQAGQG